MHLNYLTIHSNMLSNIFSLQNLQPVSYFVMAKNVTYKCRIKSWESLSKEGILEEIIVSRNKSDKVELVWMPAHGEHLAKFAFNCI